MAKISESKILYWLSLSGASVKKQKNLIKTVGSLIKLWDNFPKLRKEITSIISEDDYQKLLKAHNLNYIDKLLVELRDSGIMVVTAKNPLYPQKLLESSVDASMVMYYKGDLSLLTSKIIAIVGARACSNYGKFATEEIATTLAKSGEITVVSGIATGVDTYAIDSAINAGGKVIAVLPCGHNKITPVASIKLVEKVLDNGGLVISEYQPDTSATKYAYPERNRIISGLSMGVVVSEASEKSGSLITANYAVEQNREVFAVPGPINSTRSAGCNNLLYDGANFIRCGADVLSFFSIKSQNKTQNERKIPKIIVDKEQEKVYILLLDGAKTYDELIAQTGISAQKISEHLLELELNGVIERVGANLFDVCRK